MTQAIYATLAFVVGAYTAVQLGMLGGMGRLRGAPESAWISVLATVMGAALFVAIRNARGEATLPAPFDRWPVMATLAIAALVLLLLSMRGLAPYYAFAGFGGTAFLISASFLAPRLGIALFYAIATAGTVLGTVVLDHVGAFGAPVHAASPLRLAGAAVLLGGLVMVRLAR